MGGCILVRSCCLHLLSKHHSFASPASDLRKLRFAIPASFLPLPSHLTVGRYHPLSCSKRLRRFIRCVPFSSSMEPPSPALQRDPSVKVAGPKISFCSSCGGPIEQGIPKGEEKPRAICTVCGLVHYQNPKMVVGCLVVHEDKVLLCKRSIEPSYGLWTLPAGYMEIGESAVEGAVRETWEEATAEVDVQAPFAQLDIPRIGQSRATSFFLQN